MVIQGINGRQSHKEIAATIKDHRETMYADQELRKLGDFKFGPDHIQVICGCTGKNVGDITATLKVDFTGNFEIIHCTCPTCSTSEPGERLTPFDFENHCGRDGQRDWKKSIWVYMYNGDKFEKVALLKSPVLKYYRHGTNILNWESVTYCKRNYHRDEFVRCSKCNKERRFTLHNKEHIEIYHEALLNEKWECADWKSADDENAKKTCNDEEERETRKMCRGCPRSSQCRGCTACVCFGCLWCRFLHCSCRSCVDLLYYGAP